MKRFNRTLARLKVRCPLAYRVKVEFVPRAGEWAEYFGQCQLIRNGNRKPHFLITIVNDLAHGWHGEQLMVDGLVHEWGHALAWNHSHDVATNQKWHGPEWGVAFAAAYCAGYNER